MQIFEYYWCTKAEITNTETNKYIILYIVYTLDELLFIAFT